MLAGVIAADVIENGGGVERVRSIANGVAGYIIDVHEQLAEQAAAEDSDGPFFIGGTVSLQ